MSILTHLPLDHVAVAVESISDSSAHWERLTGSPAEAEEVVEEQGVRVAFFGGVELIEPLSPDSGVGRFLARRGPGLHHLALRVPDLDAELSRLKAAGVPLLDEVPRDGARGHRVAFIHPRGAGGILVELVEVTTPSA
jgi:methylmalonyl-CoA/ethylmalonyl-CoA epimerase